MRRVVGLGLVWVLLAAIPAWAQEIPKLTPERQKLVTELLSACIKDGGLKVASPSDGKGKFLQVVDREKVRATLVSRRDKLTAELRDALLAFWGRANEASEPAVVLLLEVFGEEKDDDRARGLAAFLTGWA